jgi:hypothetical protein
VLAAFGCSGSSFEVASTDGTDTGSSSEDALADTSAPDDTSTDDALVDTGAPTESGMPDSSMPDTSVPPPDTGTVLETGVVEVGPPIDTGAPTCVPVGPGSSSLYVDAAALPGGTGSFGCPVKTIRQALGVGKNMGVLRTVHVAAGNYAESDVVSIGSEITVVSEGGSSTITGGSSSNCSGISDKCVARLEGSATLDGFVVDASGVAVGVAAGSGGTPAKIANSTIKNAAKTGLVTFNSVDVTNVHVDDNGDSNVWVRNGTFHVLPGTNSFDRSKGVGGSASGSFVPAAGILVFNGATLNFEGGTANGNQAGIQFDWGSSSSTKQSISGLTAMNNRAWGLMLPQGQKAVILRKSTLVKNSTGGAYLGYDSSSSNNFDLGTLADPGGNTIGGAVDKNTKVGIFICHAPAAVSAEGSKFTVCPPSQVSVPGCDTMPASYADVGYATTISVGSGGPVVDTTCTVGP